ncbi:MAG: gamma-glutamyltransferase [Pseudomonadota bacterium]
MSRRPAAARHRPIAAGLASLAVTLLLAGCAAAPELRYQPPPEQPEAASGLVDKPGWATRRTAVAAANPLATDAGRQVLRAGGSAVDAAIAVQLVLTLVEPQSSGIGGGAFLMHFDGRQVRAYDGRETAPAAVDERLFLKPDGQPMAFIDAVVGGRAVGVPGTLRLLERAHREHGKLPWAQLFAPAILLAEQGFKVSPRLATLLAGEPHLRKDPAAAAFYYPGGEPLKAGQTLRNPALAAVLRRIAQEGPDAFYQGSIARSIVAKVTGHPSNPGKLSEADLATYRPRVRDALCHDWQAWRLCGFPPPSSGHLAILQTLGILEAAGGSPQPALVDGVPGLETLHRYTESARLAFADRAQYVADPDFVDAPGGRWSSLIEPDYLRERAGLIGPQSMKTARPGVPPGARPQAWAPQPDQPEYGTSHLSIVDEQGHAVAMTTTIEDQFGARQLSDGGTGLPGGFLLNNELTDFSFAPADAQGRPIANRVQPGKRPRSSMSPTLVFDRSSGALQMSAGSPGGALIIHYTAKTLLGTLAWGLNAQQAIALPNFGTLNGPTLLEAQRFPAATVEGLKARGHEVREMPMTSGLQAIQRTPEGWFGGADPRREGIVLGD